MTATATTRDTSAAGASEAGSVTVEFLVGAVMLVLVAVSIVQVGLYVYVRSVAVSAAREGARRGAVVGAGPDEAVAVAQRQLDRSPGLMGGTDVAGRYDGDDVVVTARATVPGIGFVPDIDVDVEARSRDEDAWLRER